MGADADRHDPGVTAAKDLQRAAIGGIFDDNGIRRIEQGIGQQPHRLLRAAGDKDVVGMGGQTQVGIIARDGPAQCRQPRRIVAEAGSNTRQIGTAQRRQRLGQDG